MEQRIGSSSQPLETGPLKGAGFDPAFVPGLTSPVSGEAEDAAPERTEEEPGDAVGTGKTREAREAQETEASGQDTPEPSEEALDGPVFEAADRRARIVADRRGIRLALDDQECEFRWDEIGAVETETARFGKRYTVTVHTPEGRWYPLEIDADSRRRFGEWDAALDRVLDAYFDDGAEEPAGKDDAEDRAGDAGEDRTADRAEAADRA